MTEKNKKNVEEEYLSLTKDVNKSIPFLSIIVLTYNHELYIRQCLDSILSQKCNFDFEIILGEDDSSDKTREICIEYAEKYKNRIRLFLRSRKDIIFLNGTPTGKANSIKSLKAARGKYIAYCDGDDYWTDPYKLQKQVDFLEENKEYSYCGHKSKSKFNTEINNICLNLQEFGLKELLRKNLLNTSTLMFRKDSIKVSPTIFKNVPAGDWYLQLFAVKNSKAYVLPDYMSVYRIHEKGIWSHLNDEKKCLNGVKTLEAIKEIYTDKESISLINEAIERRKKDFGMIKKSRIEKTLLKVSQMRIFNFINFKLK